MTLTFFTTGGLSLEDENLHAFHEKADKQNEVADDNEPKSKGRYEWDGHKRPQQAE